MTTQPIVAHVDYMGDLRTESEHLKSQKMVITDAPVDNCGKGEAFSPTDLVSTALASCMITIMGIKANEMGVSLEGTSADVTKVMSANPRRIAEVVVAITLPESLDSKTRMVLEATAKACPVAKSLHPDVKQTVSFVYK